MSYGSNLSFKNIRVKKFIYEINENVSMSDNQEIMISMTPNTFVKDGNQHFGVLELEIKLFNENYIEEGTPFFLDIIVQGAFEDVNIEDQDASIFDLYLPSMIGMMYAYVRSYISGVTGMLGETNINIPTINVLSFLEDMRERQSNKED